VIDVEAVLKRSRVQLPVFLAMIEQSLPYLWERMAALRKAIDADDKGDVAKIAHTLKGSAASLGMEEVREQAFNVEQIAKGVQQGDSVAELETMEAALQRTVEHAEALKASSRREHHEHGN
jgi:HPt (histidine-containing phosphotransfer) domain-containing protein